MNVLLDTHVLVWLAIEPDRVSQRAMEILFRTDTRVHVSFVSGWEYGVKRRKTPEELPQPFEEIIHPQYSRLGLDYELYRYSELLPPHHRDPFDRMLIAQARARGLTFMTKDRAIRRYDVETVW